MLSRRALLRNSVLAAAGIATIGLGAEVEYPRLEGQFAAVRRRFARAVQPAPAATWQETLPPGEVVIQVDPAPKRSISPLIYGVSVASQAQLDATGARLNRWGGNPNSRYNWVNGSAWNAARDWEFRNYGATAGGEPRPSSAADAFVAVNTDAGATSWITVPALGWVARDGDNAHASTGVPAQGGVPLSSADGAIGGYDPRRNRRATSVQSLARKPEWFVENPNVDSSPVYQDEWINHLVSRFGSADDGGVAFYSIDNEPDLWPITHTDVHPAQPGYADMLSVFLDYAAAIKDVDPAARVTGPALSGWTSMFYSARDRGTDNYRTHADRRAHGDTPFLPWWLDQMREHDRQTGRRLLDALDVHFYPQAPGVFGPLGDEATQRLRLRSTRALWDPAYVDESWIGEAVNLIPRLRAWRDDHYPGTAIGIGEWNWGADDTLNGALAIANVLGIFGREGVDLASYWTTPAPDTPGAHAFALYTNYDGAGHGFGDRSVFASSSAPDDVAVYASRESDSGDLVIVALNHRPDAALPVSLRIAPDGQDGQWAAVEWYVYDGSDPSQIRSVEPPDMSSLTLPPESLSLVRFMR